MDVVSITIDYEGYLIKICNGRVFLPQFGTTSYNNSPHLSYREVPIEKLKPELREYLQKYKVMKP